MVITSLSEFLRRMQCRFTPVPFEPVRLSCITGGSLRRNRSRSLFFTATAVVALALGQTALPVWSAELPSGASAKARKTVAAGVGYQDAETSSITVKTYDADSGEVLSAETYELDIKDDGPPSSHPRARIFAGGVGVGADGLSDFTLRVYDASNGRFLWEGRLNLGVSDNPEVATHRVAALLSPRAAASRVSGRINDGIGQPYFVLRAMNPETGKLIWADEFSAIASTVRVERISRSIVGMMGGVPREIDFRIKMPDEAGRHLLWEDKVVPDFDEDAAVTEQSDGNGRMLPGWSHGTGEGPRTNSM